MRRNQMLMKTTHSYTKVSLMVLNFGIKLHMTDLNTPFLRQSDFQVLNAFKVVWTPPLSKFKQAFVFR